jgi:hypothetical protein
MLLRLGHVAVVVASSTGEDHRSSAAEEGSPASMAKQASGFQSNNVVWVNSPNWAWRCVWPTERPH